MESSFRPTSPYLTLLPVLALLAAITLPAPAAEPQPRGAADLAKYDALIKPKHRQHWAFQPVRKPPVPAVKDAGWVRNLIDAFVLARLEEKSWKPSPAAEPRALLRRLYLDLVGLPPSLAEQEAFLRDPSPQALDRIAADLLARPAYGERWGRHWLDLVRYAETNGYERDGTKPHAWRYRDYVIRSFNADKPFDRFLLEQLAGDELPDTDAETLVATGYYRLGPWDDEPADPNEDRFDQLDDMVSTTAQVFLGLTLGCCRCHNHKFEPLTALDYYRMVAIFNPLERPQNGRTELDSPIGTRTQLKAIADRDRQIAKFAKQIGELRNAVRAVHLKSGKSKLPGPVLEAFRAEPAKRTDEQRKLVAENSERLETEVTAALRGEAKQKIAVHEEKIRKLRQASPDLQRGYFMQEPSPNPPVTHILLRGSAARPGPQVPPGVPTVVVDSQPAFPERGERTSLRRLTLARWIASPDNPLTARVIVNRIWQYHFGEGLVRTPSDFGVMGEPPTHPELLDWLADRFIKDGWSIKKLHRLIVSSNTYRMSKRSNAQYAAEDPENRLLWRVPYRRLEVEAIRDSILAASGQLNPKMYGPSIFPQVPKEALEGHSDPDKIWPPFDEKESSRRTVYAFIKRSMVVPMLEALDLCDTARTSAKRSVTTVAPQALTLFNGDFVNRQARHFADRLVREAGDDPEKQVERAYLLALCRPPTATERATMLKFVSRTDGRERQRALEQMCRVVFNLNEFVYAD
ncbi:MAG TPA: DUF1549 and DUF1553 domain-containing protein [Gemmataceae bacterium]|nr:DUF1549 and DUF1553 domain-containing protein [Gemmataceae bacterium]